MSTIPSLLKLKDYITLTGTTIGLVALICGSYGTRDAISLGFFLISLTFGTDLIDGYIARKTGTVNEMGRELDSLSDSLTFGIVPAVLCFQAFKTGMFYDYILAIGCICFALGAILRLARFNISKSTGYTGVPTPITTLLILVYFYFNYFYAFAFGGLNYPFLEIAYSITPFLLIFFGWLNITTYIKFAEKGKSVYTLFIFLAPLSPIFGIIGILNPNFIVSITISLIFLGFFLISLSWVLLNSVITQISMKKEKKTS